MLSFLPLISELMKSFSLARVLSSISIYGFYYEKNDLCKAFMLKDVIENAKNKKQKINECLSP